MHRSRKSAFPLAWVKRSAGPPRRRLKLPLHRPQQLPSLSNFIMVGEIIKLAKDFGNKGMIWPLFYAGAFFLVFNGIVTLALSRTEKKLDYFRV